MNLLRLAAFTGERRFRDRADRIFASSAGYLTRAPLALPRMLCALDYATSESAFEVALAGEPSRGDFETLRRAAFESANPNRVLAHADDAESLADVVPLVASRRSRTGAAAAYVCRNFACDLPVSDPAALRSALDV